MEPIDSSDSEAIGWHLIARGGDMTARVHRGMQLGVLPSGDFSFDAPDAVVRLDLAGEALTLEVVAEGYELELEAGDRTQALRVGAQTHICLDFLGHTLDIDNDFAVASAPGDALALFVVRTGQPRQPLGPLSAPAHAGDILVQERSSVTPLKAVPVDYLQREHAAAAKDKRQSQERRSNVRRVVLALVASVLVVAGLVVTALYVASRSVEDAMLAGTAAEATDETDGPIAESAGVASAEQSAEQSAEASPEVAIPAAQTAISEQGDPVATGVSQDMLARLSALLEAEPLPDKATIDFAVESLRSLMLAYPDDPRIPAALTNLNERLVQEARQSYDEGDAFRAGRLIEQATVLGLAEEAVAETLDYFASQPPGASVERSTASAPAPAPAPVQPEQEVSAEPEPMVTEAEAEAMLIEALAQEEAAADVAAEAAGSGTAQALDSSSADSGLDSLVESATGLALGSLAVEVIVEDAEVAAGVDPDLAALGPVLPLTEQTAGIDSTVQMALDNYLEDSLAGTESVDANELPEGFAADESLAGSAAPETPAAAGPRYQAYSELQPVRQAPLVYPSRALEGAEGSVDVEFVVTETGRVIDVKVTGEAPAIFLREAERTVRSWRFAPVLQDGKAVPVSTSLRITYRS